MAITQTGAMYKSLSFDNTSSRSYGVYITGEAVYNAPERAVEMISIPGRNGAFALDQGRFENIEVSYPAGIFAKNEADFAQAVSDFRNFLCSKKGYCRLTDEYNPSEYRMVVYKSGLEVDPAQLRAGEFTITFECKPQRWLTSGETASTVANNGTMTNPTLFESSPLLEVTGYGTIGFNGYEIELDNATLGDIEIGSGATFATRDKSITLDASLLNSGDTITVGEIELAMRVNFAAINNDATITDSNSDFTSTGTRHNIGYQSSYYLITTKLPSFTFTKGNTATKTNTVSVSGTYHSINSYSITCAITITASATGVSISRTFTIVTGAGTVDNKTNSKIDACIGTSTKSRLGNPTYIDCDLGEAYRIDNGVATSLNAYIDLGSDLPKLAPGSNTFTKDNTITQLKVTPRWWKV